MYSLPKAKETLLCKGLSVKALWVDGVIYDGKVTAVDRKCGRVDVSFHDGTMDTVQFRHLLFKSPGRATKCDGCCGTSRPTRNLIVKCSGCGFAYHQDCHVPKITAAVAKRTVFMCRLCVCHSGRDKSGNGKALAIDSAVAIAMRKARPYEISTLTWDQSHKFNSEKTYCYCGGPGLWYVNMLQCAGCLQWYHSGCLVSLHASNTLLGDRFYHFVCLCCSDGKKETLEKLNMCSPSDALQLALFNMQEEQHKKFFDFQSELLPWLRAHSDHLLFTFKLDEVTLFDVLMGRPTTFQWLTGSGTRNAKSQFGLRNKRPPRCSRASPLVSSDGQDSDKSTASSDGIDAIKLTPAHRRKLFKKKPLRGRPPSSSIQIKRETPEKTLDDLKHDSKCEAGKTKGRTSAMRLFSASPCSEVTKRRRGTGDSCTGSVSSSTTCRLSGTTDTGTGRVDSFANAVEVKVQPAPRKRGRPRKRPLPCDSHETESAHCECKTNVGKADSLPVMPKIEPALLASNSGKPPPKKRGRKPKAKNVSPQDFSSTANSEALDKAVTVERICSTSGQDTGISGKPPVKPEKSHGSVVEAIDKPKKAAMKTKKAITKPTKTTGKQEEGSKSEKGVSKLGKTSCGSPLETPVSNGEVAGNVSMKAAGVSNQIPGSAITSDGIAPIGLSQVPREMQNIVIGLPTEDVSKNVCDIPPNESSQQQSGICPKQDSSPSKTSAGSFPVETPSKSAGTSQSIDTSTPKKKSPQKVPKNKSSSQPNAAGASTHGTPKKSSKPRTPRKKATSKSVVDSLIVLPTAGPSHLVCGSPTGQLYTIPESSRTTMHGAQSNTLPFSNEGLPLSLSKKNTAPLATTSTCHTEESNLSASLCNRPHEPMPGVTCVDTVLTNTNSPSFVELLASVTPPSSAANASSESTVTQNTGYRQDSHINQDTYTWRPKLRTGLPMANSNPWGNSQGYRGYTGGQYMLPETYQSMFSPQTDHVTPPISADPCIQQHPSQDQQHPPQSQQHPPQDQQHPPQGQQHPPQDQQHPPQDQPQPQQQQQKGLVPSDSQEQPTPIPSSQPPPQWQLQPNGSGFTVVRNATIGSFSGSETSINASLPNVKAAPFHHNQPLVQGDVVYDAQQMATPQVSSRTYGSNVGIPSNLPPAAVVASSAFRKVLPSANNSGATPSLSQPGFTAFTGPLHTQASIQPQMPWPAPSRPPFPIMSHLTGASAAAAPTCIPASTLSTGTLPISTGPGSASDVQISAVQTSAVPASTLAAVPTVQSNMAAFAFSQMAFIASQGMSYLPRYPPQVLFGIPQGILQGSDQVQLVPHMGGFPMQLVQLTTGGMVATPVGHPTVGMPSDKSPGKKSAQRVSQKRQPAKRQPKEKKGAMKGMKGHLAPTSTVQQQPAPAVPTASWSAATTIVAEGNTSTIQPAADSTDNTASTTTRPSEDNPTATQPVEENTIVEENTTATQAVEEYPFVPQVSEENTATTQSSISGAAPGSPFL